MTTKFWFIYFILLEKYKLELKKRKLSFFSRKCQKMRFNLYSISQGQFHVPPRTLCFGTILFRTVKSYKDQPKL